MRDAEYMVLISIDEIPSDVLILYSEELQILAGDTKTVRFHLESKPELLCKLIRID